MVSSLCKGEGLRRQLAQANLRWADKRFDLEAAVAASEVVGRGKTPAEHDSPTHSACV